MRNRKKKIAIIGAGISGLYLAWKISKDFDVTVYGGPHAITVEDEEGFRVEATICHRNGILQLMKIQII